MFCQFRLHARLVSFVYRRYASARVLWSRRRLKLVDENHIRWSTALRTRSAPERDTNDCLKEIQYRRVIFVFSEYWRGSGLAIFSTFLSTRLVVGQVSRGMIKIRLPRALIYRKPDACVRFVSPFDTTRRVGRRSRLRWPDSNLCIVYRNGKKEAAIEVRSGARWEKNCIRCARVSLRGERSRENGSRRVCTMRVSCQCQQHQKLPPPEHETIENKQQSHPSHWAIVSPYSSHLRANADRPPKNSHRYTQKTKAKMREKRVSIAAICNQFFFFNKKK